MTSFSENNVSYPDGQQSVGAPPDAVMLNGFIPETAGARGQPLPAQWLNWLFRTIFRLINRDRIADSSGVGLFNIPNSFIRLEAIDKNDTSKFIVAIGYKADYSSVHTLKVINSSGLTLGTATASGNQPVLGGSAGVIVLGTSRQIGDI